MKAVFVYLCSRMQVCALILSLVIITTFMTSPSFSDDTFAERKDIPFFPGEKFTFQARWSFIPAAKAVLEVLPIETLNGSNSYHFVLNVKTFPFADLFYKVRDRFDSYTDINMTHSLLYKKRTRGKRKKNVVVHFDWEKRETQYSNFGEKREPVLILPGSFDPLSVFYAFRLFDLHKGVEIQAPVTDGKKCVIGKAKVIKREKIRVSGKTYDTFLIEPFLEHVGGVFEKSKGAKLQIWVTADERKIPVRLKSKVVVGSFVGTLISYETGG